VVGSCEHGNERSCSTEGREFLDQLNEHEPPNKDSDPQSNLVTYLKIITLES
jgi:hypothetical protein